MEDKKSFIKKISSFFKKKIYNKKIEPSKKIETDVKIITNERRAVGSADNTTDKVATVRNAKKITRTEVEIKKCPHCGADLSAGINVRSRQIKGRGSSGEDDDSDSATTYQSSRLLIGNNFFPDTLTLSGDGISFREGSLFGSKPRHFNYREVAFVRIKRGILFSDVHIELARKPPISLDGLLSDEAKEIKDIIHSFRRKRDFDNDD